MLNIDTANTLSSLEALLPGDLISVFQRIDALRVQLVAQEGPLWRYSSGPQRDELEKLESAVRQLARSLTPDQQNAVIRAGTWLLQKGRIGASSLERFVLRASRRAWLIHPDLTSPHVPIYGR
jgi:hypothetical protein